MSEWKAKRFWKAAETVPRDGGYAVDLDGRAVKTPAKAPLVVPTRAMAAAIATEWDAQENEIDPRTMPVTRSANAAIDKVLPMKAEVIAELAGYGGTDLLCYRAKDPEALCQRQAESWDPWLTWATNALDAPLVVGSGVMHVVQPPESLARLHDHVAGMTHFELAALHDLVALSGSLILALAVTQGKLAPEEAWALSRIDEDWQIAQWGSDEEAAQVAGLKRQSFLHSARFYQLSNATS